MGFICVAVVDLPLASWNESDPDNNVMCFDIKEHVTCHPELKIALTEMTSPSTVVRNYNSTFVAKLYISNTNDSVPVSQLSGTRTNYDIDIFLQSTSNSYGRLDFMLKYIPIDENQKELVSGATTSITAEFVAFVSKEVCQSYTELCIEINPAKQSSYLSPITYTGNRLCYNATKYVECFVPPIEGLSFTSSELLVLKGSSVDLNVSWTKGIEVQYNVSELTPITDFSFSWNWEDELQAPSLRHMSMIIKYACLYARNVTLQLVIWNDASSFTKLLNITVEPDLTLAMSLSVTYTPDATPLNVTLIISPLSDIPEVLFWCHLIYGDGNSTGRMFTLRTTPLVHVHTYMIDYPDALFSVLCRNHFTNISIQKEIILRQEIQGLSITPVSEYNVALSTVIFSISLTKGSHVRYAVEFGDGSVENVTDSQRLSSLSPYLVQHVYTDYDTYTVCVHAWNEHFQENTSIIVTIHWLCDIPEIHIPSQYTDVNSPFQIRKSKSVNIEPEILVNCTSSTLYNTSWKIRTPSDKELFSFHDMDFLFLKPRTLDYGRYVITFSVSMFSSKPLPEGDNKIKTLNLYLEIIKSPLKVSIEHGKEYGSKFNTSYVIEAGSVSYDPDLDDPEDKTGMKFRWFCRRIDEEFQFLANGQVSPEPYKPPPDQIRHPYLGYGGCFQEGPGIIATSGGSYSFNTGDMIGMTKYVFRVEVFKDDRWGFFEQEFYVGPRDPPLASIICLQNCEAKTSIFTEKIVKSVCEAKCGDDPSSMFVVWELYHLIDDDTEVEVPGFANKTRTGIDTPKLFLDLSSLAQGQWYKLVALNSVTGSPNSTLSLVFLLNKLASSGTCSIEPETGVATETKFVASCEGWKEWNPLVPGGSLRYEYRVKAYGSESSFLFYYGINSKSMLVDLPLGNSEHEMKNTIEFAIIDGINDPVIIARNVTVLPRKGDIFVTLTLLLSTISDPESFLAAATESGNFVDSLSYLFSISSIANIPISQMLNSTYNETEQRQLKRIKDDIRKQITLILQKIPVVDPGSLSQMNDVLRSALAIRDELNMDSLALAMNTASRLTSSFVALSANSSLGGATLRYANDITKSAITVMETGAYTNDNPSHDGDFAENATSEATPVNQTNTKLKAIMKQGMANLGMLSNSISDMLEMGDPAPVFTFDSATLLVAKSDVNKLSGSRITTGQGQLKYPQKIDGADSNGCAAQKVLFLGFNPYIWSSEQQESNIDSSVLSLDLSACNRPDVTTNKTRNKRSSPADDSEDQQLEFELKVTAGQPECFNRTIASKDEMIYHVVEGPTGAKAVKVFVQLMENASHSIDVYIGYGSKPTLTHYDLKSSLRVPVNGELNDTEYLEFVSAENLTSTSTGLPMDLYVGLIPIDQSSTCDDSICDSNSFDYCILLEFIACQMWDDVNDVWITDSCKVDTIAKDKVKFKSNLFGNFGAGLFVPPNTIDFNTVFDDFGAKLIENLPVVMTVVTVIVLYIPLVIICRKYDKKDKFRWKCLPLVDNFVEDRIQYELHVLTGLKKNASCTSNVSFILYGSENDTGIRKMSDGFRQNFTRGNVASFTMMTPWSLGEPVALKIWHDNTGKGALASWYLSKVVVVDVDKQKWYLFTCNTWLGGGNPTEAIFTVDTDSHSNTNLLQSNMARKLFEDHIWLSVVYRLSWSAFTRVQRLSCCLAVLFLTMVMNAMWYKTDEGGSGSSVVHIGPISFSMHELYTGTVSSLIIVPPVILMTTLFVKSLPPKKEMETGRFVVENGRKRLPHWCQYIAWFLTVLAIAVGAFFTILYSFQFGGEKSKKWLIAFLLGFFESVFIIQPTKVMIVAILLSFIMKEDSSIAQFEELLGKKEVPKADINAANPEAFTVSKALAEEELKSRQHEREKEAKARILVKEVIYYTVFILFLACVIYTNQDRNAYLQKENIMNTFFGNTPEVINRDAFWSWAEESVVSHLYLTEYYNNKPVSDYDQRFITDTYSLRVGPPRLRQARKKSEVCRDSIVRGLSKMFCILPYSIANEERATYSLRWQSFTNHSDDDAISSSFQYRTSQELNGTIYWGIRHRYSGGGYVANLGNTKAEASAVIAKLKKYEWIDDYTAAVFVEFSLYNANTGLFSLVIMAVEFEAGATVTSHTTIDNVQLYRYNGANGVFSLLTEIACLVFIIVITVMEARRLIREKWRYFHNGWNWIQLIAILFFLTAMSMYAIRSVMTQTLITVMMNNRESITNFQPVTMYNGYFLLFLGGVSFLVHIQMLHVLHYVKSIALMTTALRSAMKDMLGLGYATVLLLLSFTATMALCFQEVEGYESFYIALGSSLSSMMQKFDFYKVTEVNGLAGGALLLMFVTVMKFLVINFLISMLNETLLAVKADRETWAKDTAVIEHLKHILIAMVKGNDSTREYNLVRHEEDTQYSAEDLLDRIDILEQLVLAYDGPPRAIITADLVDYFLQFGEQELTADGSDLSLLSDDGVSLDSGTGSDMDINDVHVTVGEVDINNAQRLVEAFCQLFHLN